MQRYFVKNNQITKPNIIIRGDDAMHISIVMRMKVGMQIEICDEDAHCFLCEITTITKHEVFSSIVEEISHNPELTIDVTIAQGLIRREKVEEVIQKISELGANCYIPLKMERSIVKISAEQEDKKLERYQKIAKEASEQAHRIKVMQISKAKSLQELIENKQKYDLCLFAYEETAKNKGISLKQALSNQVHKKIVVVIGPEGGITPKEAKELTQAGFIAVGLGPRILRTETAPQYILSSISYQFELGE
jgi:16S rRNA (uracil1498-N3)-methyltransferase